MNKSEFLNALDRELSSLPYSARRESLAFYEEAIDDRMEDGMDEDEAVAAIGAPADVARAVLDGLPPVPKAVAKTCRKSRTLLWVLAVCGAPVWLSLLAAFVIVVAAVYVTIWALIASLWILVAGLGVGAVLGIAVAAFGGWLDAWPFAVGECGGALLCAGLTVLCLHAALVATRKLAQLSSAWAKKAVGVFTNRYKAAPRRAQV